MASDSLYQALAQALSRPSKAYRATQAALNVPEQALQGYVSGSDIADKLQEHKLENQTLFEALGGKLPPGTEGYGNLTVKQFKPTAELLTGLGSIQKSAPEYEDVMTQADALKAKKVPKGTKIITPQGETKTFIGNNPSGQPLLMDKSGVITVGFVPSGGPILPKSSTMPSSPTRSSGEFANSLLPHISQMRDLVAQADQKGLIGPTSGRLYSQFLAGKIGSTGDPSLDKLFGELRSVDSLVKSGTLKVHLGSRGGSQMFDHLSNILNSGKMSAAELNGSLNGIESFLKGYAEAGNTGQYRTPSENMPGLSQATPSSKPKTIQQNGFTYTLNDQTGKYE